MTTRCSIAAATVAVGSLALGIGITWPAARPTIIELSFGNGDTSANADELTLQSIRKVGRFYTVNYYGDYEQRLRWLNDEHLRLAGLTTPSPCSLFVTPTAAGEALLGRNLDRRDVPVLAKCAPPGKYDSFSFVPSIEAHLRDVLVAEPTEAQKQSFLHSLPFYVTDGINEKGLAIAIAGAPLRPVKPSEGRRPMFVLLFIRQVLDNCQSVEEVARYAETVSLYDRSIDTISHHFLVADATGAWLVIDYPDGSLRLTRGHDTPQARTNHFLDGGPSSADTRTSFWRYRKLEAAMNSPTPPDSDAQAMALLKRVRDNTAWSVVYMTRSRQGLLAVREDYRTQYRFRFSRED